MSATGGKEEQTRQEGSRISQEMAPAIIGIEGIVRQKESAVSPMFAVGANRTTRPFFVKTKNDYMKVQVRMVSQVILLLTHPL